MDASTMDASVLVTVGTTRFDALVRAVDTPEFAAALLARGYRGLVIQAGDGDYRPHRIFPPHCTSFRMPSGLYIEWFDYAPSLEPYIAAAKLVISHAGAGSLFEALGWGCAVIAVPNPNLMDDHQRELANKLQAMGHLGVATPDTLVQVVKAFDPDTLKPYVPGNASGIVARIDEICGISRLRKKDG
jgi:beta-1,4-N-acetylglucosaminyltransferase